MSRLQNCASFKAYQHLQAQFAHLLTFKISWWRLWCQWWCYLEILVILLVVVNILMMATLIVTGPCTTHIVPFACMHIPGGYHTPTSPLFDRSLLYQSVAEEGRGCRLNCISLLWNCVEQLNCITLWNCVEGAEQLSWFSPVGYRGGRETPLQLLPSAEVQGFFKIIGLVKRVLEEYFRKATSWLQRGGEDTSPALGHLIKTLPSSS